MWTLNGNWFLRRNHWSTAPRIARGFDRLTLTLLNPLRCANHCTEGGRGPLITSYHPGGASTARHPLRGMMMRRLTEGRKKRCRATQWITEFLVSLFSAVEQQGTHRENKVKKSRDVRENHQNKADECNFYFAASIVFYYCGRCLRKKRSDTEVDKGSNDVVSIPRDAIKKNHKRGVRLCSSERKRNMEDIHPFLRGDIAITSTEIR